MEASAPEEQLERFDDACAAILIHGGPARLYAAVERRAGMGPPAPDLAPVGGRGGASGPDPTGGFPLAGPLGGGPTVKFKVIQFHPLVVHSSMQIEL
jgi:hypothetical protein